MDQDFLQELRSDFAIEAAEYISTVREMVQNPSRFEDPSKLEEAYRALHNLKGAAQTVSYPKISSLCQAMESLLSAAKKGSRMIDPEDLPVIASELDLMESLIAGADDPVDHVIRSLTALLEAGRPSDAPAKDSPAKTLISGNLEGYPVSTAHGDITGKPQEKEEATPGLGHKELSDAQQDEPDGGNQGVQGEQKSLLEGSEDTVRVSFREVQSLMAILEDLVTLRLYAAQKVDYLTELKSHGNHEDMAALRSIARGLREDLSCMDRSIKLLLQMAADMGMIKGDWLLRYLRRSATGLAAKLQKDVAINTSGGQVRMDRRVMETLKDPLMHLIRNALDHGIEPTGERAEQGKPPRGTVEVAISTEGSDATVTVRDDGRGIPVDMIKERAVTEGIVSMEEAESMGAEETLNLIFHPGLSTAPEVSDVSGRGIGMSIVREALDRIGGTITVATAPAKGTTFVLRFPTVLRTYRGVMVEVEDHLFSIPSSVILLTMRLGEQDSPRGMAMVKDKYFPVVDPRSLMGLKGTKSPKSENMGRYGVAIQSPGGNKGIVRVDRVMGEHEGILKNLGSFLGKVPYFIGGTILGSGKVVPVLDVKALLERGNDISDHLSEAKTSNSDEPKGPKRVLVVEDSLTSRALLRNVISSMGYQVETASDGQDGWEKLSSQKFQLVITDVEMPRMGGIELTKRIRSNPATAKLPVIVITSLDAPDQVRMGLDAGADAYLSKKDFDQDRLKSMVWGFLG